MALMSLYFSLMALSTDDVPLTAFNGFDCSRGAGGGETFRSECDSACLFSPEANTIM